MCNEASATNRFTGSLPPRPNPEDGEPFPPPGLSYFGSKDTQPDNNPYRETRRSHKPAPPPELGPVLAWHRENRKGKIATFISGIAIYAIILSIVSWFQGDGFGAMLTYWQLWPLIIVFSLLATGPFSYMTYSAGADWLQVDRVRWGKHKRMWVDLYELTRVHATYGGTTFHLELYDKDIGLARSFEELQQDRRIWDLVYNGILHSVANGATVSKQAIGILQLNKTPALRLRQARGVGDEPNGSP